MRAAGPLWRRLSWSMRPPVLALGGGGARGFAHIGFLEVLERAGVKVAGIAGTSAGAVIGGMFLALGSSRAVLDRWRLAFEEDVIAQIPTFGEDENHTADHPLLQAARKFRDRVVISLAVNKSTLVDAGALERAIDFLVPDVTIEELGLPFTAVATNLITGEEVRLDRGPLRRAVMASSSIPGIVPPVVVGGVPLVDAGVIAEVPVAAARAIGRRRVIAVDVSAPLPPYREGKLVLETLMRTGLMTSTLLRECQLREAHIVVHPEVGSILWSDWSQFDRLVECGRDAARRLLGLEPPLEE